MDLTLRGYYSDDFSVSSTTRIRGLSPLFTSDFPTTTFCPSRMSMSVLNPVGLVLRLAFLVPDAGRHSNLEIQVLEIDHLRVFHPVTDARL